MPWKENDQILFREKKNVYIYCWLSKWITFRNVYHISKSLLLAWMRSSTSRGGSEFHLNPVIKLRLNPGGTQELAWKSSLIISHIVQSFKINGSQRHVIRTFLQIIIIIREWKEHWNYLKKQKQKFHSVLLTNQNA